MKSTDCIIIGAGLSGLACALTLNKQGYSVQVLEAQNFVGGRVQTHQTGDGFLMDEGFQVLLSSYPELEHFVDIGTLDLQTFNSGALIYTGQKQLELLANPLVHPQAIFSGLFQKAITIKDKALVLKLVAAAQFVRTDSVTGEKTTEEFLHDFGFSKDFIEIFWRPFLTGVLLDEDLSIKENFFKFLMRCFCTGKVTLPMGGMQQLPQQMAKQLPEGTIQLQKKVASYTAQQVTLEGGQQLSAKQVICAADISPGNNLISKTSLKYREVTTHYFTSPMLHETGWGKWLVLIPRTMGLQINHLCLLSEVAGRYSSSKTPLLSVSLVGAKNISTEQVQAEVSQVAGYDLKLKHLKKISVPKALPVMDSMVEGFAEKEGIIFCGDHWASPSINGALRSGRLAAEFVIQKKL